MNPLWTTTLPGKTFTRRSKPNCSSSACRPAPNSWRPPNNMAEFLLKYADTRGQIHQQVANAGSERELRDRYTQQGFLIYSIKTKGGLSVLSVGFSKRKKLNIEKFLIFNQQFVTLIRAGLPILKALDLLVEDQELLDVQLLALGK